LRRPFLVVVVALLLAYAVYGWFLRPELSAITARPDVFSGGEIPVTNHENWPRLGWYLSPVGVWLGVLGGCLLVWRVERRTVLLVTLGWLFTILYLWNISANPHHVYVMRRYVPVVVPFLLVAGAYLIGRGFSREWWRAALDRLRFQLPQSIGPLLAAALAVVWLAGLGWEARGLVSQVDNPGLVEQIDGFAERLPLDAVLLFNDQAAVGQGDIWGTPLRFIYGHDVFSLRQPPESVAAPLVEAIKTWHNSGRTIVWIGDTDWLDQQSFTYRMEQVAFTREALESSYFHKPRAIVSDTQSLTVSYLELDE